jgi:chorismate mutase
MTTPAAKDVLLDEIRQEIDGIDDAILDLMVRRLQASERVRSHKIGNGTLVSSPIRPAREAEIMRRLLKKSMGVVPPELLVRLWRVILTSSTLFQAAVTLHIPKKLASQTGVRLRLRDHFGTVPVEEYRDETQALLQVSMNSGDICAVETTSSWADAFAKEGAGEARVISVLPVIRAASSPELLLFGHAKAVATGDDETLIVSDGKLPRDFLPKPLWQLKSGSRHISGLPGFLSEHEAPLIGLVRSNAALRVKVAGRYPSQIGVDS